tara:strand:+ start:2502 stop:4103 length:1602 start_codon:yes stop_codon:yes gene_type:complete
MAYPEPTEVAPWYLRNITQALELNTTTGQVFVRTGLSDAANIIITGNVTIPGEIDTHITAIGSLGNITTPYMPIGGNVNVDTITGNVTVIQGTSPWVVSGNVTVADGGGSITVDGNVGITGTVNANITGGNVATTIGGTNLDAFGRLRVSDPYTLFDSQNLYIDGDQFSNITATSGTVTYVANESSFNLAVTAANGSSVIRQCRTTQAYQPGKSLLTMNTFAMATLIAGCRQRVGYFTASNGVYFEAAGETLYLVIRSSTTGTVVEERIAQSSWNGDRLTGAGGATNPSGIDLDPTLTQIFWADIEWLGVGNVRAGFIINGVFIVCHTFQHANQAGNTTVYMTTATLNPRYEITNTSATGGARTMKQICSTVISEGGYNPATSIRYVPTAITPTRITSGNVFTSLASIRLNPAYPDAVVVPAQIDLLLVDVQYGTFQLVLNASNVVANTGSWSNTTSSVVQYNTSALEIGDGTVVYSGLTSSRDTLVISEDIKRRLQLSRTASGTPDILTLCVAYQSNNADLLWKFGWEELTN